MTATINSADLPALYKAANATSLRGQRKYLALLLANLSTLVVGALCTAFSLKSPAIMQLLHGAGGLLLGTSFLLTLQVSQKKYEPQWYGGRAAAESVKTSAWRYMTCAEPYQVSPSASEVDQQFVANLQAILAEGEYLEISLGGIVADGDQVTAKMRELRLLPLEERKHFYLDSRISDQRRWYSGKSKASEKAETTYFRLIMVAQAAALAFAILLVARPTLNVNLVGAFSTAAAALLAWMQVKQHQELAQSYAIAAHELGLISVQAEHVSSESDFSTFVADAEAAISREHTLWVARRDRLPRFSYRP